MDGVRRHQSRDVGGSRGACRPASRRVCRRRSASARRIEAGAEVADAGTAHGLGCVRRDWGVPFDLFYEHSPRTRAGDGVSVPIRLAKHTGKPLVIHSRDGRTTPRWVDDKASPSARSSTAPRAVRLKCASHSTAGASSRSAASSRSERRRSARSRADDPRGSRRPRRDRFPVPHAQAGTAGSRTNRTGGRGSGRARPGRGVDPRPWPRITRDGAARWRRTVTPARSPSSSTCHGVRPCRRSVRTFSPTRTPPVASCASPSCDPGHAWWKSVPESVRSPSRSPTRARDVCAVELDRHLVPILEEVVAGRDVEVINGDAFRVDWGALLDPRHLVDGGEPSVQRRHLRRDPRTETAPMIERFLVMVQREVGERMVAPRRCHAFGAVSVKVAYYATGEGPRHGVAQRLHARADGGVACWFASFGTPAQVRGARRRPAVRAGSRRFARGARGCGPRSTGVSTRLPFSSSASIRSPRAETLLGPTGPRSPMPRCVTVAAELDVLAPRPRDPPRRLSRSTARWWSIRTGRSHFSSDTVGRMSMTLTGPSPHGVPIDRQTSPSRAVEAQSATRSRSRCTSRSPRVRGRRQLRQRARCSSLRKPHDRGDPRLRCPVLRARGYRYIRGLGDQLQVDKVRPCRRRHAHAFGFASATVWPATTSAARVDRGERS